VVAYYQNNGEHISHYLEKLEELRQEKGWIYGRCWLPHDAEHELLGQPAHDQTAGGRRRLRVKITPNIKIADGINAARTIFPLCWFDEEACEDGIAALRQYHYDIDPQTGATRSSPVHDWSSHGADGFRYMGVALKDDGPRRRGSRRRKALGPVGRNAWMAR
jgi:phage terminase large subunit